MGILCIIKNWKKVYLCKLNKKNIIQVKQNIFTFLDLIHCLKLKRTPTLTPGFRYMILSIFVFYAKIFEDELNVFTWIKAEMIINVVI